MQVSSHSGGMSPLNSGHGLTGGEHSPADLPQGNNNEVMAKLTFQGKNGPTSIPVALNFAHTNQNPSALNFASPQVAASSPLQSSNPLQSLSQLNNTAGGSLQNGDTTQGGVLSQLQQLLQEFMQQLMQMLTMSRGDGSTDPTPASSGGSGNSMPLSSGGGSSGAGSSSGTDNSAPASTASAPATGSVSNQPGDTSLKTNDPAMQKLVDRFGSEYVDAAKQTGVPAKLLAAVTMQESGGDTGATSTNPGNGKTDSGMNQINPDTYASMRAAHPDKLGSDMNDPKNQIMCTALMLKEGKDKFGSYDAALRAYNSGDDQVDLHNLSHITLGDPNYVKEVNAHEAKFL